jgi:predicted ATPase
VAHPKGSLAEAVDSRGGIGSLRSLFARSYKSSRIEITVDLRDGDITWTYFLSIKGEGKGKNRPIVHREQVRRNGSVILDRPDKNDENDSELLTQTALEQISRNFEFRDIAQFFERTVYLHPVPQIIRDQRRMTDDVNDPFGGDFITQMNRVQERTRNARLRRVTEALRAAVPQFENLAIEHDDAGHPHLMAGYKNWHSHPVKQREETFSDGTLRLIGLLWSLSSLPEGSTLLLEEPELSLSSDIVAKLPSVFYQAQRTRKAQVFITSHANELIDAEGIDPSEVLILQVTDNGTTGSLLAAHPDIVADIADGVTVTDAMNFLLRPPDIDALNKVSLV